MASLSWIDRYSMAVVFSPELRRPSPRQPGKLSSRPVFFLMSGLIGALAHRALGKIQINSNRSNVAELIEEEL